MPKYFSGAEVLATNSSGVSTNPSSLLSSILIARDNHFYGSTRQSPCRASLSTQIAEIIKLADLNNASDLFAFLHGIWLARAAVFTLWQLFVVYAKYFSVRCERSPPLQRQIAYSILWILNKSIAYLINSSDAFFIVRFHSVLPMRGTRYSVLVSSVPYRKTAIVMANSFRKRMIGSN